MAGKVAATALAHNREEELGQRRAFGTVLISN